MRATGWWDRRLITVDRQRCSWQPFSNEWPLERFVDCLEREKGFEPSPLCLGIVLYPALVSTKLTGSWESRPVRDYLKLPSQLFLDFP